MEWCAIHFTLSPVHLCNVTAAQKLVQAIVPSYRSWHSWRYNTPVLLPSWSSSRSSSSPSLRLQFVSASGTLNPNIGPKKRALTNQSYYTSITSSGYDLLGNASVICRPPRARAIVLFVKNSMPLFAKVLVVTENENKKHAALKRRAGQRN